MLAIEPYFDQLQIWPRQGRHILAQYDQNSVIVYQAYKRSIGEWAIQHQQLGGPDFSYARMSWIKPNFLWMMYRSGWGTKKDQEMTLALRLPRTFFDGILGGAVESTFSADVHKSHAEWKTALETSDVRVQWDPDHDPHGKPEERRAIQLGLRGKFLRQMGEESLLEIIDVSEFVIEQSKSVNSADLRELRTPKERVYEPANKNAGFRLGISDTDA